MWTRLSWCSWSAAITLFVCSVWEVARPVRDISVEPSLLIQWPGPELGELSNGHHELLIRITNRGDHARRVFGVPPECRQHVCHETKTDVPISISPRETVECVLGLKVTGSGPFETSLTLFFEEDGLRACNWMLRGVAVASEKDKYGDKRE